MSLQNGHITDKVYGTWDALIEVVSKRNIGDIVSNDDAREEMLKIMGRTALYSFNTFYNYLYLLARCNIVVKLGKTKQFDNKCGGFKVLRNIDISVRQSDIKKLYAIPSWLNWFTDPNEVLTRKIIMKTLKHHNKM